MHNGLKNCKVFSFLGSQSMWCLFPREEGTRRLLTWNICFTNIKTGASCLVSCISAYYSDCACVWGVWVCESWGIRGSCWRNFKEQLLSTPTFPTLNREQLVHGDDQIDSVPFPQSNSLSVSQMLKSLWNTMSSVPPLPRANPTIHVSINSWIGV